MLRSSGSRVFTISRAIRARSLASLRSRLTVATKLTTNIAPAFEYTCEDDPARSTIRFSHSRERSALPSINSDVPMSQGLSIQITSKQRHQQLGGTFFEGFPMLSRTTVSPRVNRRSRRRTRPGCQTAFLVEFDHRYSAPKLFPVRLAAALRRNAARVDIELPELKQQPEQFSLMVTEARSQSSVACELTWIPSRAETPNPLPIKTATSPSWTASSSRSRSRVGGAVLSAMADMASRYCASASTGGRTLRCPGRLIA